MLLTLLNHDHPNALNKISSIQGAVKLYRNARGRFTKFYTHVDWRTLIKNKQKETKKERQTSKEEEGKEKTS